MSPRVLEGLPGAERIAAGLRDLDEHLLTEDALLVLIGAPRLRQLGIDVPTSTTVESPEHRLYEKLAEADDLAAHSRYNALIRLLVSFERAAACAR